MLFGRANYMINRNNSANLPWLTNAMNNIQRVSPEERLFGGFSDGSGRKLLLKPKAEVGKMDDGHCFQVL